MTPVLTYKQAPHAFDYDHLTLVPRVVSNLRHRLDADTSSPFGDLTLQIPLIGSPMPDVCGIAMCQALSSRGALGILHRFQTNQEQVDEFKAAQAGLERKNPALGAAIGVSGDYQQRFSQLYTTGCRIFCLDTANGAHTQVETAIKWIHHQAKQVFLIAGNVASAEAFSWLEAQGVDAIRVGIAGGSVCETKTETGVFVPTPYAVAEVAAVRKKALIIGDSGVRTPSDMCKLLALGADVVMLGSSLAGTKEAPGQVIMVDNKKYKIMRGAASFSVQKQSGKVEPEYVEGAETLALYKGSVSDVIQRYLAGLRSSMSYMNAKNLNQYRENVSFAFLG